MNLLSSDSMDSPAQRHFVSLANDLQWINGNLETLGNPHHYINQQGQETLTVTEAEIAPWMFSGLPTSQAPTVIVRRSNIQFLVFHDEEAIDQYTTPPQTASLIINLPLVIVRGNAPLMSEAKMENFLDFWKGGFIPAWRARF